MWRDSSVIPGEQQEHVQAIEQKAFICQTRVLKTVVVLDIQRLDVRIRLLLADPRE